MADKWEASQSRQQRQARQLRSLDTGSQSGRVTLSSPPPAQPPALYGLTASDIDIVNSIISVLESSTTNVLMQELVSNFISNIVNEIANYLIVNNNDITNHFTSSMIQEITEYLTTYDNRITNNFAGSIIQEITNYFQNNTNEITENYNTYVGGGAQVLVQPDDPLVADPNLPVGTLWFDTDEPVA